MPYIEKAQRKQYDRPINKILDLLDEAPGMPGAGAAGPFTYVVYRLLKFWSGKFWMRALGVGCLVCAILEMYRKEHGPYEDEKIKENGDV
jgi:hypothetical protein